MKKNWLLILAILICPILASCATIMSTTSQKLPVITTPSKAKVTCNGIEQLSPCTLILDRTVPSYQITIEKEGYKPVTYNLKRGINGWVFGNLLFGGIVGIVIDVADGAVYKFNPSEIDSKLVPKGMDALAIEVK